MTNVKYALFTLLFLTSPGFTLCQNIFQVYDSYTLEEIDSVQISVDNKKAKISKLSGGKIILENVKNNDKVTFKSKGYYSSFRYLEKNRKAFEIILLNPTKSKLEDYKNKTPYYQEYTLTDYNRDFPDSIMHKIDSSAMFPGGKEKLYDYLRANINYPEVALDLDIEGKVIVQFIVEADGSMTAIHITKSVNQFMDAEAYRVIQNMPKWNPATYKGEPTKCIFNLPVTFKLG